MNERFDSPAGQLNDEEEPNACGGRGRHSAQLTWAVAESGELAHVSEVQNGLKCACTCPVCDGALVARQGKVKEHHFAHASGEECRHAAETALYLAAKDMLAKRKEIALP